MVVAICLLICVGAFAKSAQVPLHTWLPDAMEGPTPVSALIHAATMVTAGVYLIARMWPYFELAPTAADVAAFVGLATLLIAATIALAVTDLKRIIAYSTMSQIGYMIMGVSIGAYVGGLFLLIAHAFFKALLFMAAGSVIAAMANNQNIDRMSGFRRAMPFTSALLLVGCLALAAFPLTSGFFSKDEILAFAADRGGMYWIFAIGGYIGAVLTAFYAFRIGFRVVTGPPCEEAKELEQGHLHHAEPVNPATGEPEDTDVGFPGPEHHIAEREWPMKVAMAVLGLRGPVRRPAPGAGRRPRADDLPRGHLRGLGPVPHRAHRRRLLARAGCRRLDLGDRGPRSRTTCYVRRPGITVEPGRAPTVASTPSCSTSGTSTSSIDALVYRPAIAIGRFANSVFERRRRAGDRQRHDRRRPRGRAPSSAGRSRASCAPTRCSWSAASRRSASTSWWWRSLSGAAMLNALLWAPLAGALVALVPRRSLSRWAGVLGAPSSRWRSAIALVADFELRHRRPPAHRRRVLDPRPRRALPARRRRDQRLPRPADDRCSGSRRPSGRRFAATPSDGRAHLYYFLVGLAETAALGAFLAQDLLLFVLFFDLMLVPFFFLIGAFGEPANRIAATTKMLVYTLVGSLLMLVGAIATAILVADQTGELTFSIPVLRENLLSTGSQEWIFCFFAAAFLVKMPAFPIHGWMPDAYRAAPLPVLVLLSAVLSKVGAYGFLRVALPLFPEATVQLPGGGDGDRASPRSSTGRRWRSRRRTSA